MTKHNILVVKTVHNDLIRTVIPSNSDKDKIEYIKKFLTEKKLQGKFPLDWWLEEAA